MFQTTVVNKYLKSVDQEKFQNAWESFQAHFHNPKIQENIRNSKEEQYQGEFLIDLFVNVLGYTKNPTPGYNLTTELKNTQDSKKADGAIVINKVTKAVIELKGTKTTDLTKVQEQAFNYKTSHKGCDVVIISNFEKLRLFIRNQTEYQEFNLFTLDKSQFDLLYLLLAYDYFEKEILIKIKDESLSQEEEITKKLYKDYSDFKRELFQDLVKQNPQYDALTLFKSSQKLLDRFLFLFFAEDRGLLPPNAVREILRQWKKLQELDAYDTLINRFRKYFGYLNTGFKGKKYDVFAYNGGLFAADEVLDHVDISDDILYQYTQQLADYDYQSEVDVNILGHIFENSLNEIEEVRAELAGETVDKSKTKRKKDGVFYTPKYITQYIVENTVGKLCEEKKTELDIDDEDYDPGQNYQKKTIAKLEDKLVAYYDWLTQLTICDPACGSGAFLNQALDYLIKEHEYLMQLRQNLYAKDGQFAMAFPFSENDILENNLYGVDINEESVEIAKLSLWLRTAKPNRKLNSLNQNIKVGNSLIDDPEVAGEKAFVWEKEFAHVFEKGGFDVVIGNPPYGIFINENEVKYYSENYPLTTYKINLYILFIEKMLSFENSIVHFIIPKSLLFNSFYKDIREVLLTRTTVNEITTITEEVFEDADVGSSLLINFKVKSSNNNIIRLIAYDKKADFENKSNAIKNNQKANFFLTIPNFEISIVSANHNSILLKLNNLNKIKDSFILKNGLNPGNIKHILIDNSKLSNKHKPIVWGKNINKYNLKWSGDYINYDNSIHTRIDLNDIKSKKGMRKQSRIDYALRDEEIFLKEKIIIRKTGDSILATYDNESYYFDTLIHGIYSDKPTSLKALLAILNSKPATIFYRLLHDIKGKVFAKISLTNLADFPIPILSDSDLLILSNYSEQMLSLNKDLQAITDKFIRTLNRKFEIEKLSKKLEAWHELSYAEFVKELKKKKVNLSLAEEAEWEDYFIAEKTKADNLKNQINQTDKEIDAMVYDLYGLTEEEIEIVENS